MRSTMLSGTAVIALAALLSLAPGIAGAQTQSNTDTTTDVETTTEGTDTQTEVTTETEVDDEAVVTEAEKDAEEGVDAAALIGDSVENADGDVLGDIETLVVTKEGSIKHVVIGVGGFLGIGEKEVAVAWDQIEIVPEEDRIVANITREELEASAEFNWPEDYQEGTLVTARDDMTTTTGTAAEQTTTMVDADGDGVDDALEVEQAADEAADEAAEEAEEAAEDTEQAVDDATDDTAQAVDDAGETLQPQAQFLAGSLIGARILSQEDEEVGEVDDVVLAADGSIQGVITEIGGFLGIDEKQVLLSWSDLEVRRDESGDILIRTGLDAQALEGLENFDYEAARAGDGNTTTNN